MIYASRMKERILYHIFTKCKYIIRQRRISYRDSDISLKIATIYGIISKELIIMRKEIEINGCVEIPEELTMDVFTDAFIEWIESKG